MCVHKCGFIIHPKLGWLGASPDGKVTDLFSQCVNGSVEFKCPYAYRDKALQEACKDENFYCGINDNSTIFLKLTYLKYSSSYLQVWICFHGVTSVFTVPKESLSSAFFQTLSGAVTIFQNLKNITITLCYLKLFIPRTSHLIFCNTVHIGMLIIK